MEIIKKVSTFMSFAGLYNGQTFIVNDNVYLKVEEFQSEGDEFNCVRLQDGEFAWFSKVEKVEVVSCRLYVD